MTVCLACDLVLWSGQGAGVWRVEVDWWRMQLSESSVSVSWRGWRLAVWAAWKWGELGL